MNFLLFFKFLILVVTYSSDPIYKSSFPDGTPHLALETQEVDFTADCICVVSVFSKFITYL